jgi:hypothetical protein
MHPEHRKARVINVHPENFIYSWLKGLALKRKTSLRGLVNEILKREHERHESKTGIAFPPSVNYALSRVDFDEPEELGAAGMRLGVVVHPDDVDTLKRFADRAGLDLPGFFDFLFQLQKVEEIKRQLGLTP